MLYSLYLRMLYICGVNNTLMASKKNRTKQKYGKENRPSIKINK